MRIASKALVTAGAVATVAASFTGIASAGTSGTVTSATGSAAWLVDGQAPLVECAVNNGGGDLRWSAPAQGAKWVWANEGQTCVPRSGHYAVTNSAPGTHTFTTGITLSGTPTSGTIAFGADDVAFITVNGHYFGGNSTPDHLAQSIDIASALRQGHNDISVSAVNNADPTVTKTNADGTTSTYDCKDFSQTCNPAGFNAVVTATYSK